MESKGGHNMPQIIPIKELKNTSEISEKVHASEEPIFVTRNGYGDMVVMSIEMYERDHRMMEIYEAVEESEEQIAEGKGGDAWEGLAALRKKYGI